jgi:hypothetical protein
VSRADGRSPADPAAELTDEQLAGETPIEGPADAQPVTTILSWPGLCEDVDNDLADETAGAPTPEGAIEAFIRENSILQDTTIIGTTIAHRGQTVGEICLTGSAANGYHVTRANWCYPGAVE